MEERTNENLLSGVENENEFLDVPASSNWERRCGCCGVLQKKNRSIWYCHYWKLEPLMPIFVCCMMMFSYLVYLICALPRYKTLLLKLISFFHVTIVVAMFFWSYLSASLSDPGYLPFNWVNTKKTKYTWEELMDGTVTTPEQLDYVKSVKKPFDSSFSTSYGRYVLRADHICGWIANWVGKRNHKQFILLSVWGFISTLSLMIWEFVAGDLKSIEYASVILEGVFCISLLCSSCSFIYEITFAQTRVQKFKGDEVKEKSRIEAMREVCGSAPMICWIIPFHAFPDEIEYEYEYEQN